MNRYRSFRTTVLLVLLLLAFTAVLSAVRVNTAVAALSGGDVDTEAECRWCHCLQPGDSQLYLPNRHHSKVQQPIPGSPTGETYQCLTAACHQMTFDPTTSSYQFTNFRDCIPCHTKNPPHHKLAGYQCMQCHEFRWMPSISAYGTVLMNWCGGAPHPAYDPPVAAAGPDQEVLQNANIQLDGSSSFDPELTGQKLSYQWDFGDGSPYVWGKKQVHRYITTGVFHAKLTVYNLACSSNPCTVGRCGVPCLTSSDEVQITVK